MAIADAKKCARMKTALLEETGRIQAITERYLEEASDYLFQRIPEASYDTSAGEAPRKVRYSTAPIEDRGYASIGVEGNTTGNMVGRGDDGTNQNYTVPVDRNGSFACNIPGQTIYAGYDVFGRTLQATAFETPVTCAMDLISKEHVPDYFRMLREDLPKRGMEAFSYELERQVINNGYHNTSVVQGFTTSRGHFPSIPTGMLDIGYLRRLFSILAAEGWTGRPEISCSRQAFESMRLNYKLQTGIRLEGTVVDNDTHLLGMDVVVMEFANIWFVLDDKPLRGYLQRSNDGDGYNLVPVRATKTRAGTGEGIVPEVNNDWYDGYTYVDGRREELYEVGFYVNPSAATRMPFAIPQLTDQNFDKTMFNMEVKLVDGAFIDCNVDNLKFYYRMLHAFGFESLNPERMGAIIYRFAPETIHIVGRPDECNPTNLTPVGIAPPEPMVHDDCSIQRCEDCDDVVQTPIDPRPDSYTADDCQVTGAGFLRFRTCGPIDTYVGSPGLLIKVERFGGYDGAVAVDIDSANGSAVAGTDFTLVNETLNWADGEGESKSFIIPINASGAGDTQFDITLSNPTGGSALAASDSGCITVTVDIAPAQTTCAPAPDVNATAAARQLAIDNAVDLANVTGTGTGGQILKTDVQAFIDSLAPQGVSVTSLSYKKDGAATTTVTLTTSPIKDLASPSDRASIIATLVATADIDGATLTMLATNKWQLSVNFIDGHAFTVVSFTVGATGYPVVQI